MTQTTPRRAVVAAAGAVGLTAALAACGSSDSGGSGSDSGTGSGGTDGSGGSGGSGGDSDDSGEGGGDKSGGGGGAKDLGSASDIPVGGGKVFKAEKVVVTQPEKGTFKGFSAVCTHQGCTVAEVSGGTINCPCHGSKFAAADGSVKHGPATQPLAAAKVEAQGGMLKLQA